MPNSVQQEVESEVATHDGSESFDFDDIIEDRHPRRISGPGSYDSNDTTRDSLYAPVDEVAAALETEHNNSSWISQEIARELGEGLYPPGNTHGLSDPFSSPGDTDRTPRLPERSDLAVATSMAKQIRREEQNVASPSPRPIRQIVEVEHSVRFAGPSQDVQDDDFDSVSEQEDEVEYEEYSATGELLRHYNESSGK